MMGRIAAVALVLAGLVGGVAMYYLQVYGYYDRLPVQDRLRVVTADGPAELPIDGFQGIDSDTSPIRYRACFTLADAPDTLLPQPGAEPLNAPGWFDCFDAETIGQDLAADRARAVLAEGNFRFGFDRVMALYPDGRAYLWHQMNACGDAHFDGRALPQGCPPAPER